MTTETDATNPEEVETPAGTEAAANETPSNDESSATEGSTATSDEGAESAAENEVNGEVEVNAAEFQSLEEGSAATDKPKDLNRFQEIKVTVSADLGRASIPLQTLMNLGEGSVLELDREIGSPVELVAQGVALASGEVVVVNGCFAIRVTKVYEGQAG